MIRKLIFSSLLLMGIATGTQAQEVERVQPKIWLGISGGANYNMFTGTTQTLNPTLIVPTAFHNGSGVGAFGSLLLEYHANPVLGFMLNLGYDNRGGNFDRKISPCNCPEDLNTTLSYATIQPSIRIAPFATDLYVFAGAAYSYNVNKSMTYTIDQQIDNQPTVTKGEFSNIRQNVFSTHIGIGYDIQLSKPLSRTQLALSPFVSYHPYFGQEPRSIESWSLSTIRFGLALKFGTGKVNEKQVDKVTPIVEKKQADTTVIVPIVAVASVSFTVQAPATVPVRRVINESFPLRNYVFFVDGSTEIPNRYVKLNKNEAKDFRSEQLRKSEPKDQTGRSIRQMNVYYNILNILGDRMRAIPTAKIKLIGASAGNGPELGKSYAESVKRYLVDVFGINGSRIAVEGRNEPVYPSELPGGVHYLVMLREGDRRVDIISTPDLLSPLQIFAVQNDPYESRVIFESKSGTDVPLKSWSLEVTDDKGLVQNYGPYTRETEAISGNTILGNSPEGNYKIVMVATSSDGVVTRKESRIHLARNEEPKKQALRFSILFDFDKSKAVAEYVKFLTVVVAPQVPNNGTVIIHGHTDTIGSEEYNMNLSNHRAADVKEILERAVRKAGKKGVKYEVLGFGLDTKNAPFENTLPEDRFYNRTVIIDIVSPETK